MVELKNEGFKERARIHGATIANGWVGAVLQKSLAIQKLRADRRTDRHSKVKSRMSVTNKDGSYTSDAELEILSQRCGEVRNTTLINPRLTLG